jgi:hypothetical protein
LGCLKRPHPKNSLSIKAEILHGDPKKKVFGHDRKNSFKNEQEVDLQFCTQKNLAKNAPFWAA